MDLPRTDEINDEDRIADLERENAALREALELALSAHNGPSPKIERV